MLDLYAAFTRTCLQPMLPSSPALVLRWSRVLRPKFLHPECTGKFVHSGYTQIGQTESAASL